MPNPVKSLVVRVAPDLFKALATLSDTTVRRFTVDQKDLKPVLEIRKKVTFL